MLKKFLAPIIILAIGYAISQGMMAFKKENPKTSVIRPAPSVEWMEVVISHPEVSIQSQGTVKPQQQITLNSTVSGEVIWVADNFLKGQFVKKGEPLVKIEKNNYEFALANAQAAVIEAELKLTEEQTRFRQIQEMNNGKSNTSSNNTNLPVKLAESRLAASKSQLKKAEKDLANTIIRAPFDSLIQDKSVDLGEVIASQTTVGILAGTDVAEIRLAVSPHDIAFISPAIIDKKMRLKAKISAEIGARDYSWDAIIERMDGEIDPVTRVFYLTAEIKKPYVKTSEQSILPFGLFVNAAITTPVIDDVLSIPSSALYEQNSVYVIQDDNTVKKTAVKILRKEEKRLLISEGIEQGDKIVTTRLDLIFDGMKVTPAAATPENTIKGS